MRLTPHVEHKPEHSWEQRGFHGKAQQSVLAGGLPEVKDVAPVDGEGAFIFGAVELAAVNDIDAWVKDLVDCKTYRLGEGGEAPAAFGADSGVKLRPDQDAPVRPHQPYGPCNLAG